MALKNAGSSSCANADFRGLRQSVAMLRRITRTLAVAAVAMLPVVAGAEQVPAQSLTLEQMRVLGYQAIGARRPDVALYIATRLLDRDPRDAYGHYLKARAHLDMGQMNAANAAGRSAFRHAASPTQRFESARITALSAFNLDQFSTAQWWLRRAGDTAPNGTDRARTQRDHAAVQARNPLRVALQFSVVPSSNVNNGAGSRFNIIDGIPVVGVLSPDAQALAGVVAEADLRASYRVRQSAKSETRLTAGFNIRDVTLDSAAKAAIAALGPMDFGAQRVELGATHIYRASPRDQLVLGGLVGRQWYGGRQNYDFARLSAGMLRAVAERTAVGADAMIEHRNITNSTRTEHAFALRASVTQRLRGDGGLLVGALFYSGHRTTLIGRSSNTVGASLSWDLGQVIGPAQVSMNLRASRSLYPDYTIGVIAVPGGRRDDILSAAISLSFPQVSYAGFAPMVTISGTRSQSNVSRFTTSERAITLGLRSQF
ncbi:MAG: hypothetical protein Q7J57_02205 [Gemmobacter sp.]|nr:hypothetical protein [Gemmobacter sp.]